MGSSMYTSCRSSLEVCLSSQGTVGGHQRTANVGRWMFAKALGKAGRNKSADLCVAFPHHAPCGKTEWGSTANLVSVSVPVRVSTAPGKQWPCNVFNALVEVTEAWQRTVWPGSNKEREAFFKSKESPPHHPFHWTTPLPSPTPRKKKGDVPLLLFLRCFLCLSEEDEVN